MSDSETELIKGCPEVQESDSESDPSEGTSATQKRVEAGDRWPTRQEREGVKLTNAHILSMISEEAENSDLREILKRPRRTRETTEVRASLASGQYESQSFELPLLPQYFEPLLPLDTLKKIIYDNQHVPPVQEGKEISSNSHPEVLVNVGGCEDNILLTFLLVSPLLDFQKVVMIQVSIKGKKIKRTRGQQAASAVRSKCIIILFHQPQDSGQLLPVR
ncbi:hypothetical protein NDU88_001694 [Pleurodeles waltl]|uniref:Uncharacterized protein n=1 Tax=Pleurodeles waltl TaxID=8319 RepID=A0AAV7TIZ4_PLEWA|nr:hypothetical protein NDU88_001694 [Pleurodeles waltl]